MFVKSTRVTDRYVCGPQLVRALGPRVRNALESCPAINGVGEVDERGKFCRLGECVQPRAGE
eukprot:9160416-Pyramimonas_sp.AAC.1